MNRNLGNWELWITVLLLWPNEGCCLCKVVYYGCRMCFLGQMAGFKSLIDELLAVYPWANYLTSLCFSSLICKSREGGTAYLKWLSQGLSKLTLAKTLAGAWSLEVLGAL